jgi:DNA-binding IscR family transcriptional regulator
MVDLYSEVLKFEKMSIDRDKITEKYASQVVESMDVDSLVEFAYDTIVENLNEYTIQELIEEVENYDPDLLDEFEVL